MSDVLNGSDALEALTASDEESNEKGAEFSKFSSGTTYHVKVVDPTAIMRFYSYGIYKKVNSFVAKNPSVKSKKGFPVENLTPWDKAWKYHQDQSEEFGDEHSQEAGKYKPKMRFAMAFFDLESGEPIIIDVSKNQGQAIYASIKKYEDKNKLDKVAFELSKEGSGTKTTVSLTPIIDMEDDLSDKERKNFENAPEKFDDNLFDGILFEVDEEEQIKLLVQAGFDVSLIGLDAPKDDGKEEDEGEPVDAGDIDTDDLPF